ncbi:trifunctional serine/threonine-protein kinase/ATP-binding protein/sensor histidine kinase [Mastigocladopsis repens]|uniref:trifunctional serine/threonine-protein kinase/ATP-binding protein/sensor histidine kinase n=1 Tax=Mastigocladopsis repens TaxID=221287 RepID=UPI0002D7CDC2|nr:ATP-binding sensor histidine kinase [Mastigocladopsis repens]
MLISLNYRLTEVLYETKKTVVSRGYRERDQQPVVIKLLKTNYSNLKNVARLKHEYEIIRGLEIAGIVKAYELVNYENGLALVLEGFSGKSLKEFITKNALDLEDFLKIAIQVSETLGELHTHNIIHKDIKPQNIIFNPETAKIKITDFSIASSLSQENPRIINPNSLEGTLAYMSPEQTGRMNRIIDYRTDFYSLGVTFYELLTGQLPFQTKDVMELIHSHMAKIPVSPQQLNQSVPLVVSNLVMKLLAKTAEDRYQNAYGLKADLEQCLVQWQATGTIFDFPLGQQDKSSQFHIREKLYGREVEVATLMEAFERISQGSTEMMLVSGYSGIGKSSLVNEVHKPMVRKNGYFISGKFDQFKRDIPYASLIQAFQELIRQLLTEEQEIIEAWKAKILEAVSPNGQVIIDVIPEVEWIVGEQNPVPQLAAAEAQNRFNLVFKKFIHVFANREHPLVLFLDDLQWADSASLKLIQLLMSDSDSQCLLIIGAYRDNEVSPTHPLMLMLDEVRKMAVRVSNITLENLQKTHVEQLIADTLNETEDSNKLAELLFKKTQGNPFFLNQLLRALYQQNLLTFDFGKRRWSWDIEQIQAVGITDQTVVELMVGKIQKLPETTQQVLKLAACIGTVFQLNVLAIVNQKSLKETAHELWEAVSEGLILPINDDYNIPLVFTQAELDKLTFESSKTAYRFLHDRVQQAAYSLIPEDQKKTTHFQIGKLLLKNTSSERLEDQIFDIVNQFNIGFELINDQSEKYELAHLNLLAGRKAKTSTAYETAHRNLTVGLRLLAKDCWQSHYELTLALHIEAVEVEYLNTNFEQAETIAEIVFQHSRELLDRVKVYEIQIQFYISQNKMRESIDVALQVLSELGIFLPQEPEELNLATEQLQKKLISWRGEKIEDLQYLPIMTDPYKIAAMRILVTVTPPVFIAYPALFPLLALTMVNLSIQYGNTVLASYAYVEYSLLFLGAMGDIDSGYRFGRLALKLLDQFDSRELKAKVYVVFNFFVRHWKEHVNTTIKPLLEAFQSGIEVGDVEYACYSAMLYCGYIFLTGESLEVVSQSQRVYIDFIRKSKQGFQLYFGKIWYQLALKLQGKAGEKDCFDSQDFDEAKVTVLLLNNNNHVSLISLYLCKTIFSYLFKNYPQAVANAELGLKYETILVGMIQIAQTNFYYSLSLLAQYPTLNPAQQKEALEIVETNQQKLKHWAEHAPENYQHKYELVEAEKARILNQFIEAMEHYDRAIQGARVQQYLHEEALAYELAAEFYYALGRQEIAQTYLHKAHFCYGSWGATAKVEDLEVRYPQFFVSMLPRKTIISRTTETTTFTISADARILDATTVIKASLALSREIILENLLRQLINIAIENAGAQKGFFIANQDNLWLIEAEGSENGEVTVLESIPLDASQSLAISVINYVQRTRENLVINNATQEERFATDPYIIGSQPQSILCLPIIHQNKLTGILYLENNLTTGAFTNDRLEVLKVLTSQVSISIENARLYAREQEKSRQLEQSLHKLQQTQAQLVQTEKISSLGQLVAGISHEVNNPIGFIGANLEHLQVYIENLSDLLRLYQQCVPNPPANIQDKIKKIDLEFLLEDLPKILTSMKLGTDRIHEIMSSLRIFCRKDAVQKELADIHEGLDSTLLILQHRLKASSERPAIQLVKEYGDLPLVECFAGQLNQVFMNLIANAIDAIDQYNSGRTFEEIQLYPNVIRIRTEVVDNTQVVIRIVDNGIGMTEEVKQQLFCPFFTTKSVGNGTGLGLSISYQIIVEKHGGQLNVFSQPGKGVEFVIKIPIQ